MFEIKGEKSTAICFATVYENEAVNQIKRMCDYDFTEGCKIRIMPDMHPGKGCTIGTTMTIKDKVVPNIVGVDLGCGMYTVNLGNIEIDFEKFDEACHYVPHGRDTWSGRIEKFDLTDLRCYRSLNDRHHRIPKSLATLGSVNHFLEIDQSVDGTKYLVIHTGSRSLGKKVADYYQQLAIDLHKGKYEYLEAKEAIIAEYKAAGRRSEIQDALKKLKWKRNELEIPEDLCYLYGTYLDDYLHDVEICQRFARRNRELIAEIILKCTGITSDEAFHTIHNYIDTDEMILRKGAIAAHKGEKVLIPVNMRDGSILAYGRGNEDWNYSAPHGAGRLFSRTTAKDTLSLEDYKHQMKDVYSTSVNEYTLDEAPMAYKSLKDIIDTVKECVDIIEVLKPIYNFKAN